METILHDARHAVRGLLKAPGFTVVALVTMAIAIGANATVFSFVNALLLRPPAAVTAPRSLVSIYTSDFSSGGYGASSYPDFESIRAEAGAFADVAASREQAATLLRIGDSTERVRTLAVTGGYFDVLGVRPILGRSILAADTRAGAEPVLVIGERLWRSALGGDRNALGSSVSVNGAPHTIVGIMPAQFTGLAIGVAFDLWTPMPPRADPSARGSRNLAVIARLAEGADLTQAQAQLDGIAARLAEAHPETNRGTLAAPAAPRPIRVVGLTRMHPNFRAQVAMISSVLVAAVTLVLLIACANVAGLLLSRATARRREVALRLALGAGRWRLVRQMMTESLILGLAGGACGLIVALWTADALPSFFPAEQARLLDARLDAAVLGFTALISVMSGLVFGVVPAIQGWRAVPSGALRADANRAGDTRVSLVIRKGLVVGQVALASVLLVSAVLLTRSLSHALDADLGFATRQAVLAEIELPPTAEPAAARGYFDTVLAEVGALPGIQSAAFAQFVPVAGTSRRGFTMDGYTPREGEDTELHFNVVSAGFFETMGISASAGRLFTDADRAGAPAVVVNRTFADRYYGGDAVGRRIVDGLDRPYQIVGVVRADRRLDLQDPPLPVVFHLLDQQVTRRLILVARTAGRPETVVETVRRTAAAVDRNAAVFRTLTLQEHLDEALAANQLVVALVLTCGVMALVLALVGIYGVVSYMVVRRTREIGVRVALGATPWQVLRLLVAEHGGMVGFGLAVGLIAAAGASRLLGSMLYAVSASDPATYAGVLIAVALVSALACLVPASRALRVSPVTALRHD
jgi:predicted permease